MRGSTSGGGRSGSRRSRNPTSPLAKLGLTLQRMFGGSEFFADGEVEMIARATMRPYGTRSGYFNFDAANSAAIAAI